MLRYFSLLLAGATLLSGVLPYSGNTGAIESNFYREETCSAKGGFCVLESECPPPVERSYFQLCPSQSQSGAICCKSFKQENANCHQLHNECKDHCPTNLDLGRKGCPEGSSCCVLV